MRDLLDLLKKAKRYVNDGTTAKAYLKMAHAKACDMSGYIKDKAERARFDAAYVFVFEECEKTEHITDAVEGAYDFWQGFAAGQSRSTISSSGSDAFNEGCQFAQDTSRKP